MQTISQNKVRNGNFTSSEIERLTGEGKKAGSVSEACWAYVEECNMEREIGRSIDSEINGREVTWGQFLEGHIFDEVLDTSYQLVSQKTLVHPTYPYWVGSPDALRFEPDGNPDGNTVCDIKAPKTLKSFCQLVAPLYHDMSGMDAMNALRNGFTDKKGLPHKKHASGEKYYWQLVSNAVLTNSPFAELIVYVPTLIELQVLRDKVSNMDSEDQYRYYWISNAKDDELPFITGDSKYKNLGTIRFPVLEEDKTFLTGRVQHFGSFLSK